MKTLKLDLVLKFEDLPEDQQNLVTGLTAFFAKILADNLNKTINADFEGLKELRIEKKLKDEDGENFKIMSPSYDIVPQKKYTNQYLNKLEKVDLDGGRKGSGWAMKE